jgi:FtsZ-interacting cell division protein YlmF
MAPALPVFSAWEQEAVAAPSQPAILVLRATELEDGAMVIEAVRGGRCVVLDATGMEEGQARRLADFSRGGVCAMDGRTHRLGDNLYLFSTALSRIETQLG